jgi:hypothetical protein
MGQINVKASAIRGLGIFPMADLCNPILPRVREELRERNEQMLAGKPGFGARQSCL